MYMESIRGGRRDASWEVPQQSGPIAAQLWDVSGSPEPSLTISFIKKESFKPNLRIRRYLLPELQLAAGSTERA